MNVCAKSFMLFSSILNIPIMLYEKLYGPMAVFILFSLMLIIDLMEVSKNGK